LIRGPILARPASLIAPVRAYEGDFEECVRPRTAHGEQLRIFVVASEHREATGTSNLVEHGIGRWAIEQKMAVMPDERVEIVQP
jgi:hypothetical protein